MNSSEVKLPSHAKMAWPTLAVLKRNGLMHNREIEIAVADEIGLTDAQRALKRSKTGRGTRTLLDYRLAWSRTLLRGMGAIANPKPAHWEITEAGRSVTLRDIEAETAAMLKTFVDRSRTAPRKSD